MPDKTLYSIIESPLFPDLTELGKTIGFRELRFDSTRKAISQLRKDTPDIVVGEFVYGYGNNYAGVNISNLDVFFYSLQKYAPDTKIIVLAEKGELKYVDKLKTMFRLHAVLGLPVSSKDLAQYLS